MKGKVPETPATRRNLRPNGPRILSEGQRLELGRLIASVQASAPELQDAETLLRLAQASLNQGVKCLRLEGLETITHVKAATGAIVIGLIKKQYEGSQVYITPTRHEVAQLLETDCEIIALDGTNRPRPDGSSLKELIDMVLTAGKTAMADCDSVEAMVDSYLAGADLIGTTLAGYTGARPLTNGPDLELIREAVKALNVAIHKTGQPHEPDDPRLQALLEHYAKTGEPIPDRIHLLRNWYIIAEGRYEQRWQVEAAVRSGAHAVTIGGALNDPVKNTRRLMVSEPPPSVVSIDIGGTWIRAAVMNPLHSAGIWPLFEHDITRERLSPTRDERIDWLSKFLGEKRPNRIGISSAGVIWHNRVTLSKKFIPENQGTDYNVLRQYLSGEDEYGLIVVGDGHASAWAHACHPDFAGKDIVVLAIGTGLGFGHVREGKIVMGPEGLYSRLNDLPGPGGKTFEQLLGGFFLSKEPSEELKQEANEAIHHAIRMVSTFLFPDVVIVCGTVGMQPWLNLELEPKEGWPKVPVVRSPFGADAGLYGAAAVALFPPFEPER